MIFWKLNISEIIGLGGMIFATNKSQKTHNWLMKSFFGFTFAKFEKVSFQKIIPEFFHGTFRVFLTESSEKKL